jgi:hypothetical protein
MDATRREGIGFMRFRSAVILHTILITAFFPGASIADEGMWLFSNPPVDILQERHAFEPRERWLEHLQKSAIRFNAGGSGSFVSSDGLVLTNHHVGSGVLEDLSTPEQNFIETGYYANTKDKELNCPDFEANVLWRIEDVTERVINAGTTKESPAEANTARREMISTIEQECETETGLDCQVVALYRGEQYHLYQYKRFTDIRLVMAPELSIAFYGGDNDNFEYPRYALDMCFFRIYENGKPYRPEHYLTWSRDGSSEGDLIFVVGHPGRTQRHTTVAHLAFLRDVEVPRRLQQFWRREVQLQSFSMRNAEYARIAAGELLGVQNGRKASTALLAGLQDPAILKRKLEEEQALRDAVAANPEYRERWGDAWDDISQARAAYREFYERHHTGVHSRLFGIAVELVRLAEELPKPRAERLPEYSDANLDSLYHSLYSPSPVYDALEIERLENSLSHIMTTFGAEDAYTQKTLDGMAPRARAVALVQDTALKDVDTRKALAGGGAEAIAASTDPMIRLAAELDGDVRHWRKKYEDAIESIEKEAYAKIATAQFAINGEGMYPDATFTLRLAFGQVKGYAEDGREVPAYTTFHGLYDRASDRSALPGYELPARWLKNKNRLKLGTPYNFVCTADITGGNSGSPVINKNGEIVGLVFDSNLHGIVHDIVYTEERGRAVAVDVRGMIEALRKVYKARALVDEILYAADGS